MTQLVTCLFSSNTHLGWLVLVYVYILLFCRIISASTRTGGTLAILITTRYPDESPCVRIAVFTFPCAIFLRIVWSSISKPWCSIAAPSVQQFVKFLLVQQGHGRHDLLDMGNTTCYFSVFPSVRLTSSSNSCSSTFSMKKLAGCNETGELFQTANTNRGWVSSFHLTSVSVYTAISAERAFFEVKIQSSSTHMQSLFPCFAHMNMFASILLLWHFWAHDRAESAVPSQSEV